ncbi:MAG: hypothetical protein HY906_04830 [Deltaproteobacteria bacterium]|nr:hypothetical protein [Deltaproteobacteria bacterium]
MRICPKCNMQNEDSALICSACSTTLPVLPSSLTDVDAFMADKARQKRKRRMMVLAVAVLAVIGGVVVGILMYKARQTQLLHNDFYKAFTESDEKSYGEFWQCFYRDSTKQAFALPSNLVLNEKLTKAYEANRKGFKTHVDEKCIPKLKEVARRIGSLNPPPAYTQALERYTKSSVQVEKVAERIADELGQLYEAGSKDKKLLAASDEWHKGYDPRDKNMPKDAIAYDHFLRCALPNFDTLKDGDAVAAEFRKHYKVPQEYVARLRSECMKPLDSPPAKVTPKYLEGYKKFEGEHEEPRDTRALKDFFRRANVQRQTVVLEPVGKAWLEYKEGRDEVLKVAAKFLQ